LSAIDHFTGERYLPGVSGQIAYEHCHRYAFARRFVVGARVLDAACGEGYGSALLADVAASVVGIDVEAQVDADASVRYAAKHRNLSFERASVTDLPLDDACIDAIVSFETIEHIGADDQRLMLAEFARVLVPGGRLILSSPNRPEYSDARGYVNPFHVKELDREELSELLAAHFPACDWFCQRRYLGSAIWRETGGDVVEALSGSAEAVRPARVPTALYFVVVAARMRAAPDDAAALSLYADGDDAEWARIDGEAREALRLDALLRERDRELREQASYANELRAIVEQHDQVLAKRDAAAARLRDRIAETEDAIAQAAAARDGLFRQIDALERIIGYRESVHWWLWLPVLRLRRLWHRLRGTT
jgi:SAM-dependent methyltransferase